jgi:hypothetical protein
VRGTAIAWGKIADVLMQRGEFDEALRIRREEQLPVYARLGDVRGTAITWGKIADVLMHRGEFDEALRIRREEQLPTLEKLGDKRELIVAKAMLAQLILMKGMTSEDDAKEVLELLMWSHREAKARRLPEAGQIEEMLQQIMAMTK